MYLRFFVKVAYPGFSRYARKDLTEKTTTVNWVWVGGKLYELTRRARYQCLALPGAKFISSHPGLQPNTTTTTEKGEGACFARIKKKKWISFFVI